MILLYLSLRTEKALISQVTVRLSPPTPSALKFPCNTTLPTTGLQKLSYRTVYVSSVQQGRQTFDPRNGFLSRVKLAMALAPGRFKNPFHQVLIFHLRTSSALTGRLTCQVCELSQMLVRNQALTLKGVLSHHVKVRRDLLGVKRSRQHQLKKFL